MYTHTHTYTTFYCCGELDYSHYQCDSSATVNDICVIYGGELCGELLILRCPVFYGLINKGCSASRYKCFTPMTIHPQRKSTQHDMCACVHVSMCARVRQTVKACKYILSFTTPHNMHILLLKLKRWLSDSVRSSVSPCLRVTCGLKTQNWQMLMTIE